MSASAGVARRCRAVHRTLPRTNRSPGYGGRWLSAGSRSSPSVAPGPRSPARAIATFYESKQVKPPRRGSGSSSLERPRTGMRALKAAIRVRGLAAIDRRTVAARHLLAWRDELIGDHRRRGNDHGRATGDRRASGQVAALRRPLRCRAYGVDLTRDKAEEVDPAGRATSATRRLARADARTTGAGSARAEGPRPSGLSTKSVRLA
jgi:hypothetical protein